MINLIQFLFHAATFYFIYQLWRSGALQNDRIRKIESAQKRPVQPKPTAAPPEENRMTYTKKYEALEPGRRVGHEIEPGVFEL